MSERPVEILLVESDAELAEMIEDHFQQVMCAQITHATSAREGLCEELTAQHDVVIASLSLPDADGLGFTYELKKTNRCPVILLVDDPSLEDVIEAARLGVREILTKPFDLSYLSDVVCALAEREQERRRRKARYRRLRKIASRIIRERRDLNRRLDLICRDFVHAYRRLAEKVTKSGVFTQEYHE